MLWLALYCPTLSLDCILRRWPEGLDPALAVTDLDGTRRLILVATRKAQAGGVFPGQTIATALSLLPDLVLVARKVEDERVALTEAALAALRFTPTVSLRASGLVMEISASLKLFDGRQALKQSLAVAMREQGLSIAAAEGPTPHGAWLLAQDRARRRQRAERHPPKVPRPKTSPSCDGERAPSPDFATVLDALPIGHLETARPGLAQLDGIGVRTLADLRRLPVKGLARRFGPELIDELQRAFGDKPDPQTVFEAPERFDARIELMARVETADALLFASQRLLAQMTGWLTMRRAAVRGFTLVLHHDRWTRDAINPTAIEIALASPSSDLSRLGTLVSERFANLELKAPVQELSLAAPIIVEERERDGVLFPTQEETIETLARLLEKMTVRLGPEAIVRIKRAPDQRPERAWREVRENLIENETAITPSKASSGRARTMKNTPTKTGVNQKRATRVAVRIATLTVCLFDHQANAPTLKPAAGCACGPRPVWLLTKPEQLETQAHRPVYEASAIALVAGPERIESGWWDGIVVTRDYFIGENCMGRLVWIYKERFPIPSDSFWYLQGLFG